MAWVPCIDDIPSSLTEDEFWRLFGRREHERLDFKRGVPSDVRDAIPAMAMTDGGLIVCGVADDRRLTGCPLSQNTQNRITRYAAECGVDVQLREIAVGGAPATTGPQRQRPPPEPTLLTICAVPEVRGRIVTTPDGRLLRRVGGDSQPLRGDAMARFVRERELRSGEDEPIVRLPIDGFNLAAINAALEHDGRPIINADEGGTPGSRRGTAGAAVASASVLRALVDLGVATAAPPPLSTNVLRAAAILFAADPSAIVRGAAVQLVRRVGVGPGPGPASVRTEVAAPFAEIVERCLAFVAEHTTRFEVVEGIRRQTLPALPVSVLREAVVNALAHRDYNLGGATVDITVWDDRVEVRSRGSLPGHITQGNMRDEHYSRNPRIMRVLKILGLVEEYGEGIDRMYREMAARLLEPPMFEATSSSVTVTLRNRSMADVEDQAWLLGLPGDVTENERRVLVVARRDGAATKRALRPLMAEAEVDAAINGAVAKGLLRRVGTRGGTRYVLGPSASSGTSGLEGRNRAQLLDEVRERGAMTSADAARLLQTSTDAARQLLNDLAQAGFLRAEGNTRGRKYHLP